MEFLIYDHECPRSNFWDAVPWMCTLLSIYVTVQFLVKLMDSSFESHVEDTNIIIDSLKEANEELIEKRDELERELQKMNDVVNALAKKFVTEDHRLTKVD